MTLRVGARAPRAGTPRTSALQPRADASSPSRSPTPASASRPTSSRSSSRPSSRPTAARAAGTAARASASRSAARSRACSAARSALASTPGQGSTFTLYLPQSYGRRGRAPRRAVAPPRARRRSAARRDERVAAVRTARGRRRPRADIRPGDRVLLIVENDPAFARVLARRRRTRAGFKALVAPRGADRRRARPRVPAGRDHARHPPARHRRLAGARAAEGRPRDPPHPRPRHLRRRGARARRSAGGALGVAVEAAPTRRRSTTRHASASRDCVERPVKTLLLVEDDAAERARIVELVGNGDVRTIRGRDRRGGPRRRRASERIRLQRRRPGAPRHGRRRADRAPALASRPARRRRSSSTPPAISPAAEQTRLAAPRAGDPREGRRAPRASCSTRPRSSCTAPSDACPRRSAGILERLHDVDAPLARPEGAHRRRRHPQHLRDDERARAPRHAVVSRRERPRGASASSHGRPASTSC